MGWAVALVTITALVMLGHISRAQKPKRIGAAGPRAYGGDWNATVFRVLDTEVARPDPRWRRPWRSFLGPAGYV